MIPQVRVGSEPRLSCGSAQATATKWMKRTPMPSGVSAAPAMEIRMARIDHTTARDK